MRGPAVGSTRPFPLLLLLVVVLVPAAGHARTLLRSRRRRRLSVRQLNLDLAAGDLVEVNVESIPLLGIRLDDNGLCC